MKRTAALRGLSFASSGQLAFEAGEGGFFQIQALFNDTLQPQGKFLITMKSCEKLCPSREVRGQRN